VPRPRTHKISIQTKGLSHEEAALLFYLLTSAAEAVLKGDTDRYESASNVPLKTLRAEYPRSSWRSVTAKERIALVT
jgi:hypothetical protein